MAEKRFSKLEDRSTEIIYAHDGLLKTKDKFQSENSSLPKKKTILKKKEQYL